MADWKITLPLASETVTMTSTDLTAGEWASIYELVAKAIPHLEAELHPAHCPLCRNAVALTALISRGGLPGPAASALVDGMSREALIGAIEIVSD